MTAAHAPTRAQVEHATAALPPRDHFFLGSLFATPLSSFVTSASPAASRPSRHRAIAANVHDEALRAAFLGSLGLSAVSESAARAGGVRLQAP